MSLLADAPRAMAGDPEAVAQAQKSRFGVGLPTLGAAALLIAMPFLVSSYMLTEVLAFALIMGTIALSLQLLAGYGGMVSLAQMTVAGLAGYLVAILGPNNINFGPGWPVWLAILAALAGALAAGAVIGALAVRTAGIYTIMITLAIATAFFYFTQQNYYMFNGYNGINGVSPPQALGLDWRAPVPAYYLALAVAGLCYAAVVYISRAPFGLVLQGIRDNARRMEALGYNVYWHRIAAYVLASLIAALGGILLVWHNGRISPGTVDTAAAIDILIIAVIGGLRYPIGAFIGALAFVALSTFAIDAIDVVLGRERFKLLIGIGFLLIVLFSPDGLIGLWQAARERLRRKSEDNF
jgi:branched-chain amino acid transport system permease protein